MKAVQGELSPLVMDLAPIASRQLEAAIPFMTTQEGIGSRWGPQHSSIHSSYMKKEQDSIHQNGLRTDHRQTEISQQWWHELCIMHHPATICHLPSFTRLSAFS